MADSSAIDNALIAKLLADTGAGGVMTFATSGVFFDEAAPGATRFVIVSLVSELDEQQMSSRAFEEATYLVKAVGLSTAGGDIKAAAARIDTLLENGSLTAEGYGLLKMHRTERVRATEVDERDPSIRWQHRGGRYLVMATQTAEAAPPSGWMQAGFSQ